MPRLRRPQAHIGTLVRGLLTRPGALELALNMPGRGHAGPLPGQTSEQESLAAQLRGDVEWIAGEIGERNVFRLSAYRAAEMGLRDRLERLGLKVVRQPFEAGGMTCVNLYADIAGKGRLANEIVVYGAHYDSIRGCPAANDNGTGVAAVMALARRLQESASEEGDRRTVRLALFANEEPPFFWTEQMGSLVMARAFKQAGERFVGMVTPETIGYFSDEPRSQSYPLPLGWAYPTTGNFVAFIGLPGSGRLLKGMVGGFRASAAFPSIGAMLPGIVPGVGSSDHWSFWKCGVPAMMVTDTAPFRYPYYHTPEDTPDKVNYDRLARVVEGLNRAMEGVIRG